MKNKIIMKCSNCGFENKYSKKEIEKVFPFSREKLKCKNCGHTLTITAGIF